MQVQGTPIQAAGGSPRVDAGWLSGDQAQVIPPRAAQPVATTQPGAQATAAGVQLFRVAEAMRILGLSRSAIYRQFQAGRLRSVHQGRSRLIPATAIAEYVALLESEARR